MIYAFVVQIKNLRGVVKNKIGINQTLLYKEVFMKDEELYEAVTGLLVKVTALEKTLIESNLIDKEKYFDNIKLIVNEMQVALVTNQTKILS